VVSAISARCGSSALGDSQRSVLAIHARWHMAGMGGAPGRGTRVPEAVEFHNIAEPGALTFSVDERQLPNALRLRPTVAAVVVGTNDTLRSNFDIDRTARALDHVIGELRATGSVVLTARLPTQAGCWDCPLYCRARWPAGSPP